MVPNYRIVSPPPSVLALALIAAAPPSAAMAGNVVIDGLGRDTASPSYRTDLMQVSALSPSSFGGGTVIDSGLYLDSGVCTNLEGDPTVVLAGMFANIREIRGRLIVDEGISKCISVSAFNLIFPSLSVVRGDLTSSIKDLAQDAIVLPEGYNLGATLPSLQVLFSTLAVIFSQAEYSPYTQNKRARTSLYMNFIRKSYKTLSHLCASSLCVI